MASANRILNWYYKTAYPTYSIWKWLGKTKTREFAFSATNYEGVEYFTRHRTYRREEDLKLDIETMRIQRIEIGPVYNDFYDETTKEHIFPERKELVFDIDIDAYDNVRSCCSKEKICLKCWTYVKGAMTVITWMLKFGFGFKRILWVFSGRRGVHCWVSDETAMMMSPDMRKSVLMFIKNIDSKNITPLQEECISKLYPYFLDHILPELDVFVNESTRFPSSLANIKLKDDQTSVHQWHFNIPPSKKLDIFLYYMWPRLDEGVTVALNHLLKSPFSAHPKTGKISVPITIDMIDTFNPLTDPPNLSQRRGFFVKLGKYVDIFKRYIEEEDEDDK